MISATIVRRRVRRPSRRKWYVRPWQKVYPGVEVLVCPVLAQKLTHILEIPEVMDNQQGSCLKSWLVPSRKFWSFTAVLPHVACPGKAPLGRVMKPCRVRCTGGNELRTRCTIIWGST